MLEQKGPESPCSWGQSQGLPQLSLDPHLHTHLLMKELLWGCPCWMIANPQLYTSHFCFTWCHGWGLAEHVLVRRGAALAALTSSTNSFPTALLREGKSGCEVQVTR